jgi:hypothetical protein
MRHPLTKEWVRVGFMHDLLLTRRPETFFAFGVFGVEYVINVGGPSIKGYEEWLIEHEFESPLIERVGYRVVTRCDGGETLYFLEPRIAA